MLSPEEGMKKLLKIAAGIGLILVGVVGLILPVMPGWVFIIPGLMILAEHSPLAHRLLQWGKARAEQATGRSWGKKDPAKNFVQMDS
jgi:uncharacterized membrane protein YbaN (DUF454 family)